MVDDRLGEGGEGGGGGPRQDSCLVTEGVRYRLEATEPVSVHGRWRSTCDGGFYTQAVRQVEIFTRVYQVVLVH